MTDRPVTVRARVTGKVQRVWYRAWTVENATTLGLVGWVRNLSNGDVEAVFSGARASVDEIVRRCWQGPKAAVVSRVDVQPCDPPDAHGFEQRPTK